MKEKIVAFAGHRFDWHCIGVEDKLPQVLEELIHKGYSVFYDGNSGAFDKKCATTVIELKHKYPHIKLIRILTYYHHNKDKYEIPSCYDGSILPDLEELHYKQKNNQTQRVDNRQLRHPRLPHPKQLQKRCLPHSKICPKEK